MSKASKIMASNSSKKNVGETGNLNIFKMLLLVGLLFVMFYTPYLRGLYFESEQLFTEIILLTIFIMFWIYKWLKNDKTFIKTPIEYAAFGLVLVYLLTTFTAVSQRLAMVEFLKYAMYFIVFLMLTDLIKSEKEKKFVLWTIVASAFGVCIIGIDSAAGSKIVDMFNAIFKVLNIDISFFGLFVDGRIHSTMQYPNAFASYLLAVFFISISLIMTSKKWIKAIASVIGFVILTTFVFTISRGAYILFALAIPVFLLLLPKGSKARGLYCLATFCLVTGVFSVVLAKFISQTSVNKSFIWPIVIAGGLISFLIRFTDDFALRFINKINTKLAIVSSVVLIVISAVISVYIFNASVPFQLKHATNEKDGYKDKTIIVALESNKKYKLIYNVDAKSVNKNPFAYRTYVETWNKSGITSGDEQVIINKEYDVTESVENREIEFTVPESCEAVNIVFQSYYSGTTVVLDDAKIYEFESGKEVKKIVFKYKYAFVESIFSRFNNITSDKSYNSRIAFVKDGFKIFKDWWLIGAGGGAWSLLNFKYQSFLYYSTQTHNYPLQVLVETGLIGLVIFLLLLIFIVLSFVKIYKRNGSGNKNDDIYNVAVFTAIIFLFAHSVMDFDFSLSSIYILVWQLIAVLNSNVRQNQLVEECSSNKYNKRKLKSDTKFSIGSLNDYFCKGLNLHPLIVIIISAVVLVWPVKLFIGQGYAQDAFDSFKKNDLDEAITLMEKATEIDNLNTKYVTGYMPISSKPDIRLGYLDLLIKKVEMASQKSENGSNGENQSVLNGYILKAQELAKKAERHAKYDAELSLNLGVYFLQTSDKQKGIDYISRSVNLKPLVPSQWRYKANVLFATAVNYFQQGDSKNGLDYINKTLEIIDEAKNVNNNNISPFIFDVETQKYLEKAYSIKKNELDTNDIVFQSVFEMDVNNDNVADQWTFSDNSIVGSYLGNEVYNVKSNDKSRNPFMYTRVLEFEPNSKYRIEVELVKEENVKSIHFWIPGVTSPTEQLILNGKIFSSEVSVLGTSDSNRLYLYVTNSYNIKNVKVVKIS